MKIECDKSSFFLDRACTSLIGSSRRLLVVGGWFQRKDVRGRTRREHPQPDVRMGVFF
jgi:hypothetical protein